ncbi:MAG: hypothetical protein QOE14_47 [Humisphaera sp.]|nr:hypothetical protein [Humisphaera sp.]
MQQWKKPMPRQGCVLDRLEARRLLAAHVAGMSASFATIQAAVDAASPGGVVIVDAGTYHERVSINKSLTIRGARAGVDARSNLRRAGGESIVDGAPAGSLRTAAFHINADRVTIDGFTVQGQSISDTKVGAGIVIGANRAAATIQNNIIQNNVAGVYLSSASSSEPTVIRQNFFRNNNNYGVHSGRGIYTDGGIFGTRLTNVVIDNNVFHGHRGGSGTTGLESAIDLHAASGGKQTNITVSSNVFDANGKAILVFNTTGLLIEKNVVTNTLDRYSGTLRFEGNVHDVLIRNNTLFNNTGPAVAVDASGVPGDSSNFVITGNNFYNNSRGYSSRISVIFDERVFSGTPDVRNNFWGDPSGPGGDGPGSGDKVYGAGRKRVGLEWLPLPGEGPIEFSPWRTTPNSWPSTPYWGTPARDGAVIQAEDYNHGGPGVAYNDTSAGNSGGSFRPREGVDVQTTTDSGGGLNIGWTKAGEWVEYTVAVAGGTYNLDFRVANEAAGGRLKVSIDGVALGSTINVPATGGWQTFQTVTKSGVGIAPGTHTVRVTFDANATNGSSANFNWFKLIRTDGPPPSPPPPPPPPPQPPTGSVTYVAAGSAWKYLDNGSNQNTAWRANSFNDSTWKSGAGQLGYGDGDEKTVVSAGPNAASKSITTYFRKTFDVADPAKVSALAMRLIRDDGVVIYLNGVEVYRNNMPTGTIGYTTPASTNIGVEDENKWITANLTTAALRAGANVIAVEIHQSNPDSADISFDMELKATVG